MMKQSVKLRKIVTQKQLILKQNMKENLKNKLSLMKKFLRMQTTFASV
jgi:hypothetical protein